MGGPSAAFMGFGPVSGDIALQGSYDYAYRGPGGEPGPVGVYETFRVFQLHDGGAEILSERTAENGPFPGRLAVKAKCHASVPDDRISRFQVCWEPVRGRPRRASYRISAASVHCSIDGGPEVASSLPPGAVALPLMRVFLGPAVLAVAERAGGEAAVLVPDIRDMESARLLHPLVDIRQAEADGTATSLALPFGELPGQMYRFIGGSYSSKSRFWIDPRTKLLLRYEFPLSDGSCWTACIGSLQGSMGI